MAMGREAPGRSRGLMAAVALVAALALSPAAAQDEKPFPKGAVVKLVATGTAVGAGEGAAPEIRKSYANGIVVSDDGFVLTVHGLYSDLGSVGSSTVGVKAWTLHSSEESADRAWIIDTLPFGDLMLLKVQKPEGYEVAELGPEPSDALPVELRSYSIDVPGAADAVSRPEVSSFDGQAGLWLMARPFDPALRGAPLFDGEGRVVGLLSSFTHDGELKYAVPLQYANSLIVDIRFEQVKAEMRADMLARMSDFEPLRREFDWTVQRTADRLVISYTKKVSGHPKVEKLDVLVSINGIDCGPRFPGRNPLLLPHEQPEPVSLAPSQSDDSSGVFEWIDPRVLAKVDASAGECKTVEYTLAMTPSVTASALSPAGPLKTTTISLVQPRDASGS